MDVPVPCIGNSVSANDVDALLQKKTKKLVNTSDADLKLMAKKKHAKTQDSKLTRITIDV